MVVYGCGWMIVRVTMAERGRFTVEVRGGGGAVVVLGGVGWG